MTVARRDGRREPAAPQRGLLDLAVVADPLRLHAGGDDLVRDAGCRLDAGVAGQQRLDVGPRRCPGIRGEGPSTARPSRRVGVRHVERPDVHVERVGDADRPAQTQRGQVRRREGDPHRIQVDPGRGQPGPGERDQVAADPAAQVDHGRGAEGLQPGGAMGGDREAGGLLQPLGREVHRGGQVTELRDRLAAQLRLGQRHRQQVGRDSGLGPGQQVVGLQRVGLVERLRRRPAPVGPRR